MSETLKLVVNGKERTVDLPALPATLADVLLAMELRADRVAVELNGELAPRAGWPQRAVHPGDRLEVVHFVGGGR